MFMTKSAECDLFLMQCDVRVLDFIKMVAFILFIDKQLLGEKQNKLT